MPSIRDVYGSRFLGAEDLDGQQLTGKIIEIGLEPFKNDIGRVSSKITMRVENVDKPVVVNATNADRLAKAFGDDYEKWLGRTVDIGVGLTQFKGRPVNCVVIMPVFTAEAEGGVK